MLTKVRRAVFALMAAVVTCPVLAASCEELDKLSLPATTITIAKPVPAGGFAVSSRRAARERAYPMMSRPLGELPAFCRVTATLKPNPDSEIKIEIWLPQAAAWNSRFLGVGNGGWAGEISYDLMGDPLARGFAVASTDTGHERADTDNGSFLLGHPETLVDFGYRAVHEMTVAAKSVIMAYYGQAPKFSYWSGCSTGGRQALMEAQRFPADFEGILAGAPANFRTHLAAQGVWIAQAVHKDEASYIPPAKYPLIHNAVLQACDTRDGVKDGVLEDPTRCKFDPKILLCKGADGPMCLTAAQVEATRKIYAGPVNPRTKQQIFPGLELGSELGWATRGGPQPQETALIDWKYIVFKNPNWDYRTLNFDQDIALSDRIDNGVTNAIDPNLKPFFGRGGKLIQYHGWSDPLISSGNSVNYYNSVLGAMGGAAKVNDSYRLFMAPGVAHCGGGEGPDRFDVLSALDEWVEKGKAPDSIVASHYNGRNVDRTRPLCPYPQVAAYKGNGSTSEAANFSCRVVGRN